MKPVLVLQNLGVDGPAYLGDWLRALGIAHDVLNSEAGDRWPASVESDCALAALGVSVVPSPAPEIGWQPIDVLDGAQARAWFGDAPSQQTVLQWHYEAFGLPDGARLLASSAACPHQAFAIGDHLALQFHLEVDDEMLGVWAAEESVEWRDAQRARTPQRSGWPDAARAVRRPHGRTPAPGRPDLLPVAGPDWLDRRVVFCIVKSPYRTAKLRDAAAQHSACVPRKVIPHHDIQVATR